MFFERTVDLHAGASYIADCMEYLTGCKSGKYSSSEQWAGLLKHANEVFSYGLEHGFVICGNSQLGRHFWHIISERYGADVILADDSEVQAELEKNKERTFILSSRKYCARYAAMLCAAPHSLNYNHLWLLSSWFNMETIQFQNSAYIKDRMFSVEYYTDAFLTMLDSLEDRASKELLARTLLYRVTLNEQYTIGVKSDEPQYFDKNIILLGTDAVFVDAGGYNGDTLRDFMDASKGRFAHYYFFEPVPALLEQAKASVSDTRIEFLPCCLWDRNETVFFGECTSNNMSGHVVEGTDGLGTKAVSLDRFLDGKPVTFIKMDIEGAEMRALRGAENSIKTYRPTLAISAYHMPNDLADIYLFCKSIGGYKLYLRTSEDNLDYELVLYAVKGKYV